MESVIGFIRLINEKYRVVVYICFGINIVTNVLGLTKNMNRNGFYSLGNVVLIAVGLIVIFSYVNSHFYSLRAVVSLMFLAYISIVMYILQFSDVHAVLGLISLIPFVLGPIVVVYMGMNDIQ